MVTLNLVKPLSAVQKNIAAKCGWGNINELKVRKNILPKSFISSAKYDNDIYTVSTPLTRENITVFETITGNDKIFNNSFVKSNMTEILRLANDFENAKILKSILKPENLEKLDSQRMLVKRNPRAYLKDKSSVKYLQTPAGLNTMFNDISLLKAAEVLDKESLDALFKMDITQGLGQKFLSDIGKMNLEQMQAVKADIVSKELMHSSSKLAQAISGYLKV